MFVAAGLVTVLAAAALMEALHLSTALGAFVAGVMLADSPYRHELEADVEPFRSILLGLFFLSVGMVLDLHAVAMRPAFVFGMAAVLIAVKTAVLWLLCRLFGMKGGGALAMGLLLSQGGEFGFVLFAQAQNAQLILPEAASLFSAIVTLSMAATPFLMTISRRFGGEAAGTRLIQLPGPEGADQASAIIVGYGRFGQTVAQMLLTRGVSVTVVDTDVEMIETAAGFGMKVWYGDGTRLDLLRQAGAQEAEIIAFCLDGDGPDGAQARADRRHLPQCQAPGARVRPTAHAAPRQRADRGLCARAVPRRGGDGPAGAVAGRRGRGGRSPPSRPNIARTTRSASPSSASTTTCAPPGTCSWRNRAGRGATNT